MKIKAVSAVALLLILSSISYCAELDGLYAGLNNAVKNNFESGQNFLDNKLVITNFSNKLEALYLTSLTQDKTISELNDKELNKKIEKEFNSVDFNMIFSSVRPDTQTDKSMPCNKLAARRWLKDYKKSLQEIKDKQKDILAVRKQFNLFQNKYKALDKGRKLKFYTYLRSTVKYLNCGKYSSAKVLSEYMAGSLFD